MNCENVKKQIVSAIKDFTDIAVVGLSGGADSTLVATLCREALGADNVYGVGMPCCPIDKETFNNRSKLLANKLGIEYEESSISSPVDAAIEELGFEEDAFPLIVGNMKSRMRMIYLYAICNYLSEVTKKRVRVIGTGNLSEDFIGYDTKGGDALADFFPIGQLYKSEVYQLLDYFVEQEVLTEDLIDRVPSAGLWEGQTDEAELGYSYNEMQPAVQFCIDNYNIMEALIQSNSEQLTDIIKFVWKRHIANKHKHEAPKVVELTKL